MSSIMEGMFMRSAPELCNPRQSLKGNYNKYVDHESDLLRENQYSFLRLRRVGVFSRRNDQPQQPPLRGQYRAQAILTPVTDPTPTRKKVMLLYGFLVISTLLFFFFCGFQKPVPTE